MFKPDRIATVLVPIALAITPASALEQPADAAATMSGQPATIGEGQITPFAKIAADGTPLMIGLRIDGTALEGLPAERNATSRCFDLDGNSTLEAATECEGDTELRLPLPAEVAGRDDVPFKWAMVNWQPHGHDPMPWSVPHFDIHFYMIPEEDLDAIGLGPCDFFIACEAKERALKPVPAGMLHPDYIDVGATIGLMGNHMIDSKTPELGDQGVPFTHTWIFGAYDGRVIFQEVMVTRDYLLGRESGCHPVKQPTAWERSGWYPTSYCIENDEAADAHLVTMQDFVLRPGGRRVASAAIPAEIVGSGR